MAQDQGYTTIKIPGEDEAEAKMIEVTIDDITDEPNLNDATDDQDNDDNSANGDSSNDDGQDHKAKAKTKDPNAGGNKDSEKHKSRAQKRIKDLVAEKNEYAAKLAALEAERNQWQSAAVSTTKQTKETLKESLEAQVAAQLKELTTSIQNGEAEQTALIQMELMDTKMKLAGLTHEIKGYAEVEEKVAKKAKEQPQQQQQKANAIPEKALDWIEEYPQFKKDRLFNNTALIINDDLIAEGFDPDSEDFYEELNERLSPRFPEIFGTQRKNVVSSKKNSVEYTQDEASEDEDSDNEDFEEQDGKQSSKSKSQVGKERVQTVSGASRTPPNNGKKSTPTTVKLSAQDVAQAERWGLDIKQVARRVAHAEKNKRGDGYTPIFID